MEKKTTRRIIGVLVVIALVIILLPLTFNNIDNQATIQTTEAIAPAFPNNSISSSSTDASLPSSSTTISKITDSVPVDNQLHSPLSAPINHDAMFNSANKGALVRYNESGNNVEDTTITDSPVDESENLNKDEFMPTSINNSSPEASTHLTTPNKPQSSKIITHVPIKTAAKSSQHKFNNDAELAAELKQLAWVIQLGSFKNKINAERLTNSLRAHGYKAFTIETKSNGQTRVCVGPEFQANSAIALANKIEQDINMHGIILTYKPLEL